MDAARLQALLTAVARGETTVEEGLAALALLPYEDLGFARLDHHRALRTGLAEAIFCPGKTAEQVAALATRLMAAGGRTLCTRANAEQAAAVVAALPGAQHHAVARLITCGSPRPAVAGRGTVLVVAAGTADLPVAEEAALAAEFWGNPVQRLYDVGVAGLHRLLAQVADLRSARVLVVVAGMDGALPSVVAGLVRRPVIAVPTSVGYGAAFGGLAPLLSMLNACAAGIGVVNIDNGFGAAALADAINAVTDTEPEE